MDAGNRQSFASVDLNIGTMDVPPLPKSCAMEFVVAHFNVRSGTSIVPCLRSLKLRDGIYDRAL